MQTIELLAPAKDKDVGIAALNCGADAVYIGASAFGAREKATNSLQDVDALVQYAHKFRARVYVALNTLLFDTELSRAVSLIHSLDTIGIDGLIIQDLGLLECGLPPIPLIASTQTHNVTTGKVRFLESAGFSRVILARELSLDQIKTIRAKTTVELEVFIHGALCVCYSGQCSLSYAVGGRSANRGQCAQPCRKRYSLVNGNHQKLQPDKHFLSVKDLNQSSHLEAFLDAGISSFKIEGRLKEKPYVMNVVGHYRKLLDKILEGRPEKKSSSGTVLFDFHPSVDKSFNRGFTNYYLMDSRNRVGSIGTPKSMGEYLGTVNAVSNQGIRIDTNQSIHPGDGLCYMNENLKLTGTKVHHVSNGWLRFDRPRTLIVGQAIHRNHDHAFTKALESSKTRRSIRINFTFSETPNGFNLVVRDEDEISVSYEKRAEKHPARNIEQMRKTITRQLAKTGNSHFGCSNVTLSNEIASFVPVSHINQMRRDVLDLLTLEREKRRPKPRAYQIDLSAQYPDKRLTFQDNVLNRKADLFFKKHGVQSIEPAAESGIDMDGKKVMTTKYCLLNELEKCRKITLDSCDAPLFLINDKGDRLRLEFQCTRCEMELFIDTMKSK